MNKPRIDQASIEELELELARRRAQGGHVDMTTMELAVEEQEKALGRLTLQQHLDQLEPEGDTPRKCPGCGGLVRVKNRRRKRVLRTISGTVTLFRNYHHCTRCQRGFYPRDQELGLPANGEVSRELERRLLDFAMNDSFEHAAQRWNTIFRQQVSANLLRRVVDRTGELLEECHDAALHHEVKPSPKQPPKLLVVQNDGSMLPMRGPEPWKEAKLAVLFNGEHWLPGRNGRRGAVTQSRYVGVLGKQQELRAALDVALRMERALKADVVVWVGDGAKGNWRLASELVPKSVQVLDFHHALENAMTCAKLCLGETDPLLPLWKQRIEQLLLSERPAQVLEELQQCLFVLGPAERKPLKDLLRYYQANIERMEYRKFLQLGYPIGSWSYHRGRRMVRLRALYRSAGPMRFHASLLRAKKLTETGRIPRFGPIKRRASNNGTVGVKPRASGRHSRY